MAPAVLTTSDSLTCTVGMGSVKAQGASKLVVAGNPVLTKSGVEGKEVSACSPPPASPTPPPCTKVGSVPSGASAKLVVSGSPVLLSGLTAIGTAVPPHPIGPATAGQSKLVAT